MVDSRHILTSRYQIFQAVAEAGSFVAAARALDLSAPAISKQIKKLEDELELVLLHRTTRTVQLTEAGRRLADALNNCSSEMASVMDGLEASRSNPYGRLKISVPMSFGELFLYKPIADYAKRYPEVIVDVDFDDRRVHMVDEGYDAIIRIGTLAHSGQVALKVADCPIRVCAHPDFIAQHGRPTYPEHIQKLPAIMSSLNVGHSNTGHSGVLFESSDGQSHTVSMHSVMFANSIGMMLAGCLNAVGMALLPDFSCSQALKSGKLVQLLPEYKIKPEQSIYVIYPDKRFLPLKVKRFIETIQEYCQKENGNE